MYKIEVVNPIAISNGPFKAPRQFDIQVRGTEFEIKPMWVALNQAMCKRRSDHCAILSIDKDTDLTGTNGSILITVKLFNDQWQTGLTETLPLEISYPVISIINEKLDANP